MSSEAFEKGNFRHLNTLPQLQKIGSCLTRGGKWAIWLFCGDNTCDNCVQVTVTNRAKTMEYPGITDARHVLAPGLK